MNRANWALGGLSMWPRILVGLVLAFAIMPGPWWATLLVGIVVPILHACVGLLFMSIAYGLVGRNR